MVEVWIGWGQSVLLYSVCTVVDRVKWIPVAGCVEYCRIVVRVSVSVSVKVYRCKNVTQSQERPYHNDSTASRLLSEVKHCRARLVLRWGTTLESLVLFFCFSLIPKANVPGSILNQLFLFFAMHLLLFCFFFLHALKVTTGNTLISHFLFCYSELFFITLFFTHPNSAYY